MPEWIMTRIRQNLGLEPDDTSRDSEIESMSQDEALSMLLDTMLDDGKISVRLHHCLIKAGCKTLKDAFSQTPDQLRRKAPFGRLCEAELHQLKSR